MDTKRTAICPAYPACQNCPRGQTLLGTLITQPRPVRQKPAAAPAPTPGTAPAAAKPIVSPPAIPTPAPQPPRRVHLSAYASDIHVEALEGKGVLPLEPQRAEGKFTMRDGVATVPEDGYYMILWEAGIACQAPAALQLGINEATVELAPKLQPGYESGQQVTWLCAGDHLSLVAAAAQPTELSCDRAQLTVIRLG